MADEIKRVIQIDTGNSIQSLSEYKSKIDELKEKLTLLDAESQEYKNTLEEINNIQQQASDAISESGKAASTVVTSYNELERQMKTLKDRWKETTDEIERTDLGKQINSINNELKTLDASTGNFERSIGNYAGAFEEGFQTILDGAQNAGGSLATLAGDVRGMIPLVKQVTTAFTTGMSGIKKAIASTGIGLLVIAIGELVVHWKDITGAISGANDKLEEFNQRSKEIDKYTANIGKLYETDKLILGEEEAFIRKQRRLTEAMNRALQNYKDLDYSAWDDFWGTGVSYETALEGFEKVQEKIQEYKDSEEDYKASQVQNLVEVSNEIKSFSEEIIKNSEITSGRLKADQQKYPDLANQLLNLEIEIKDVNKELAKAQSSIYTFLDNVPKLYTEYGRSMSDVIKVIKAANLSLDETQERALLMAEQFPGTPQATEAINNVIELQKQKIKADMIEYTALLTTYYNAAAEKINEEIKKRNNEAAEEARKRREEELKREREQAEKILQVAEDSQKTRFQLLTEEYDRDIALLEKHNLDTTAREKQFADEYNEIYKQRVAEVEAEREAATQKIVDSYNKEIAAAEAAAEKEIIVAETTVNNEFLKADKILSIEQQLYNEKIRIANEYLEQVKGNDEVEAEIRNQRDRDEATLALRQKQRDREVVKNKREAYLAGAEGIATILGSIGEMYEEGSEEAKAFAISEAVINTIGGSIGAFLQASEAYPPPYGQIIGGITAASVLASGIAQVKKMTETNKDNAVGQLSGAAAGLQSVAVSPLLNEQADIQNLQSLNISGDSSSQQSAVKVYVTEGDIAGATKKVQVRESNSTF